MAIKIMCKFFYVFGRRQDSLLNLWYCKHLCKPNYQKFFELLFGHPKSLCYKIPDLMQQCITIAMYFFMFLGIFAGQSLTFHIGDKRSLFEKMITDFPFYYCIKYILFIGWLKTAKDLESPFGQNV